MPRTAIPRRSRVTADRWLPADDDGVAKTRLMLGDARVDFVPLSLASLRTRSSECSFSLLLALLDWLQTHPKQEDEEERR